MNRISHLALLMTAMWWPTCSQHGDPQPDRSASSAKTQKKMNAYRHGVWRLASDDDIGRTVLWVSHILVMYRESSGGGSPFRPMAWDPDAKATRSSDEAYARAVDLMKRAQADPTRFATLAKENSDDVVTRDQGGSLGPRSALDLPAVFVDALEQLAPGQVSEILQTSLGYHILLKRSPPPEDTVAAQRVVIRYESTFGDTPAPKRSRAEAFALARQVNDQARHGADFAALVREYSEGMDRDRGGNMGTWSTMETGPSATVIEALAARGIGDLLREPMDTQFGFQIARRVAPGEHKEFAARVVRAQFDPESKDTEAAARKDIETLVAETARDHRAIERSSRVEPIRWDDGHGDPDLQAIAERMQLSETTGPVALHNAYALVQRVEPDTFCRPPPSRYELPEPDFFDVEAMVRAANPEEIVGSLDQIRAAFRTSKLTTNEAAAIQSILERLRSDFASANTPEKRVAVYRANMAAVHRELSEASYAILVTDLQGWVAQQRMKVLRP